MISRSLKHQVLVATATLALGFATNAMAQADWGESKWGPDDEKGAINTVTPQMTAILAPPKRHITMTSSWAMSR